MTKVFLLAGQSNMEGPGLSSRLPEALRKTPDNVRFFDEEKLRDLVWRGRFGPEVGFAHEICGVFPGRADRPCARLRIVGPISITTGAPTAHRGGRKTITAVLSTRNCWRVLAKSALCSARSGSDASARGSCGCRVSDAVFEVMAGSYETNLRAFVGRVRADVGAPNLPFLIGQISPRKCKAGTSQSTHPYRDIVRGAQARVAGNVAHVAMVETMDLTQSDGLHFDAEGQIELGRRFARAYRLSSDRRAPNPVADETSHTLRDKQRLACPASVLLPPVPLSNRGRSGIVFARKSFK